jgi:hypothetical protein
MAEMDPGDRFEGRYNGALSHPGAIVELDLG